VCLHRQECKKLREELREEHEENKRSALSQLAQNKDQEMCSARESWQRKVEDLLEQVRDSPVQRLTLNIFLTLRPVPPLLCYSRNAFKFNLNQLS